MLEREVTRGAGARVVLPQQPHRERVGLDSDAYRLRTPVIDDNHFERIGAQGLMTQRLEQCDDQLTASVGRNDDRELRLCR